MLNTCHFKICKVIIDRAYDLQDPSGHIWSATVGDAHLLMPEEYIPDA